MDDILKDFPEDTARILSDLLNREEEELIIESVGESIVISCTNEVCYSWKLMLTEASGLPEQAVGNLFWCGGLRREGEGYVLTGDVEGTELENAEIRFSGVDVEVKPKRSDLLYPQIKPWMLLSTMANGIIRKSQIAPGLINEREQALLPMLWEICTLTGCQSFPNEENGAMFPLLRQRMDPKLHKYLDRMEQNRQTWKKYWRYSGKLQDRLNRIEFEPLWRGIYEEIAASQAEYPMGHSAPEPLIREIEALFHSQGYSGSYPDFIKTGEVRGLHLRDCHEMSYFIFNEKNAVFHIHCRELDDPEFGLSVEFVCGTEFLKKGEKPGDIYSCLFESQGRRLLSSASYVHEEPDTLAQKVGIAVKKAEVRKLSREERKADGDIPLGWWGLFFLLFVIFGGGFFAVFMTLGMVPVVALITWLFAGWSEILPMLRELPWGQLFWGSWLLFGGAMGIVEVIAKRNK